MTGKLNLKGKMTHTWLIQRLQKPTKMKLGGIEVDNFFSFGGGLVNGGLSKDAMGLLRDIFSFDCMGSSEFEWGAVPEALSFLARQCANLAIGEVHVDGHPIFYICPKNYEPAVRDLIKELYNNEYKFKLKEHCGLKDSLTSEKDYHRKNCGWLELDNGFMFFTDREMFEKTATLYGLLSPVDGKDSRSKEETRND